MRTEKKGKIRSIHIAAPVYVLLAGCIAWWGVLHVPASPTTISSRDDVSVQNTTHVREFTADATSTNYHKATTSSTTRTAVYIPDVVKRHDDTQQRNTLDTAVSTPTTRTTQAINEIPHVQREVMGFALGETLSVLDEEEVARRLDDMKKLGAQWVRVDFAWSSIERYKKGEFFWDPTDVIVRMAKQRGMQVLPILTYTPRWARSEACIYTKKCAPDNPQDFGDFARAAAERYAPHGVYAWEIWNEPNIPLFWRPGADPHYYTRILKAAYRSIHDVQPSATVVSGGLAPTATGNGKMEPRAFLEEVYKAGGGAYFDAVGFHPYTFPLSPDTYHETSAWSQMSDTAWSVRSIMKQHGDGDKKIWLTEFGAPTNGPGSAAHNESVYVLRAPGHVTEAYQAVLIRAAIERAQTYEWAGPLFVYSYKDLGTDKSDRENFFGIVRADGSRKQAYYALLDIFGV